MNQTKTFIIIPGNPPASHFYNKWCDELKKENPEHNFEYSPYPEFVSGNSSDYFNDIVTHYEKIIKNKDQGQDIILIGHSIGGYFASEVLDRLTNDIKKCILIFPFFGKPKVQGIALLKLISFIENKKILKDIFIKNKNILGRVWKELMHIDYDELKASTRLAHHESLFLKNFKEPRYKNDKENKLHLIYNSKDTWCPPHSVTQLKNLMPAHHIESVHDFVVYPKERELLTKLMQKFF